MGSLWLFQLNFQSVRIQNIDLTPHAAVKMELFEN
jgi:hypothetical protein